MVTKTDEKELCFKHIPVCTMLDGETCNVLTDILSTQGYTFLTNSVTGKHSN